MITKEEYRRVLNDYSTSDEIIIKRVEYLTVFCRKIIKDELEKYVREQ